MKEVLNVRLNAPGAERKVGGICSSGHERHSPAVHRNIDHRVVAASAHEGGKQQEVPARTEFGNEPVRWSADFGSESTCGHRQSVGRCTGNEGVQAAVDRNRICGHAAQDRCLPQSLTVVPAQLGDKILRRS